MVPDLPLPALQWMTMTFLSSSCVHSCILRTVKGMRESGGGWWSGKGNLETWPWKYSASYSFSNRGTKLKIRKWVVPYREVRNLRTTARSFR